MRTSQKKHREGFEWALGLYFSGDACIAEIKTWCCDDTNGDPFDNGMLAAIRVIESLNLTTTTGKFRL